MAEQTARNFLAARRAELLAALARHASAEDTPGADAQQLLDAFLDALGPSPVADALGERLVVELRAGASLPRVLARLGALRRGLLVACAAAITQGVEDAAEQLATIEAIGERAAARVAAEHQQALEQARRELAEDGAHHRELYRRLPVMMHSIDPRGLLCDVNDLWLETMGYRREEVLGRASVEFLTEASRKHAREVVLPEFFRTGRNLNAAYQFVRKDGQLLDVLLSAVADRDTEGKVVRSYAVVIDVTEMRRTEAAARRSEVQEEIIRAQEETLRALSTPLVPLGFGTVLLPLVGAVDGSRAELILAVLLEGVVAHAASRAILDVTGVPAFDASVAEAIARATRAVRLLGAEVVLTGISPAAAQTLVALDVDLGGVVTRGTLRDGIAHALRDAGPSGRSHGS